MKLRWYKFLLWKTYFEKGRSVLQYVEKLFIILGVAGAVKSEYKIIVAVGFLYAVSCLFLGRWWMNTLTETENEIQNRYNPFQKEVREKLIKKSSH